MTNRSEYARAYYARNKAALRASARQRVNARRIRNRVWLLNFLKGKSCKDCGHADIRVLEFDHVRKGKQYNIADLVAGGRNLKLLKTEVGLCELVCCNCHRLRTAERRGDTWHENV